MSIGFAINIDIVELEQVSFLPSLAGRSGGSLHHHFF